MNGILTVLRLSGELFLIVQSLQICSVVSISETEEDYQETLSLMREVGYDSAYLFKYSERPGTYAAKHLEDDVPEEVKVRRLQGMIDLQNKLSEESNKRDIGKTFEVLVEGFSKRSTSSNYWAEQVRTK